MICRVCGRPNPSPWNEDGSVNHDHDACNDVIAEASRPSVIPPGVSSRDWDDVHTRDIARRHGIPDPS